jgi:hypothetical protein
LEQAQVVHPQVVLVDLEQQAVAVVVHPTTTIQRVQILEEMEYTLQAAAAVETTMLVT